MLTNCPECELQISDKAITCPHCGYPLQKTKKYKVRTKRKRLPNGFGQITKINQNLREPYRAMVTVGKNENGKPICKILKPKGYFKTYNEAYAALVSYNLNPYDMDSRISVKELYERWSKEYFKTLKSSSSVRTINSAWSYCSAIYDLPVSEVRARHIKYVMEEGRYSGKLPTANIKSRIKSLFNLMLDYAVEYELVDRNYARTFNISENIIKQQEQTKRGHLSFTDRELEELWKHQDIYIVKVILVQCYMGWRPQELGLLQLNKIDTIGWTITGGMKTDAGTDRIVPVHVKIRPIVRELIKEAKNISSDYLINCFDSHTHCNSYQMTYDKYQKRFNKAIKELKLNDEHRPHDGRKQFITMCKKYNVDEYAIKRMVGHNISDITEKIYTDRNIDWLQSEVNKIEAS